MSQCVVLGCLGDGEVIAGKPTPWGAWEYRVCAHHKAQIDDGASIDDHPDGRTITVNPAGPTGE